MAPWPNVAEIAAVLPHEKWTLIGGLMVQLHAVYRGIGVVRPTNDVDMVLHIETARGVPNAAAGALESLGYRLLPAVDLRNDNAHRFTRDDANVDLVTSGRDSVDVLVADHAAPKVEEKVRGRSMVRLEGGTPALRRTVNARLTIAGTEVTTLSVPSLSVPSSSRWRRTRLTAGTGRGTCTTPRSCSAVSRTRMKSASGSRDQTERGSPFSSSRSPMTTRPGGHFPWPRDPTGRRVSVSWAQQNWPPTPGKAMAKAMAKEEGHGPSGL